MTHVVVPRDGFVPNIMPVGPTVLAVGGVVQWGGALFSKLGHPVVRLKAWFFTTKVRYSCLSFVLFSVL